MEIATFAGGCFWCLEAAFARLRGVQQSVSGYMGGHVSRPSYQQVCTGTTDHAEVVQVHFDPEVIDYEQLLSVFFHLHDPTQVDRQGNDVGSQYRSAIFTHSDCQREQARKAIEIAQSDWVDPIVTQIMPAQSFWVAEDCHQDYYASHQEEPYCRLVINPKLAKFSQKFAGLLS